MPLPSPNLVLALVAHEGVEPSSSEALLLDKFKMKVFVADPSKKSKMKANGMSSAYLPSSSVNAKFWKPEFSIAELGKQVIMVDSTKDHNTNLALRAGSQATEGCR